MAIQDIVERVIGEITTHQKGVKIGRLNIAMYEAGFPLQIRFKKGDMEKSTYTIEKLKEVM